MKQYLDLMQHILKNGMPKGDRTNTRTLSIFGHQLRFSLEDKLPILTTKKIHTQSIIHELLWFLKGDTNIKYLKLIIVSIIIVFSLVNFHGYYTKINKPQWRDVAYDIDADAKSDDLLLFHIDSCQRAFDYYSKRCDLIKKAFPEANRIRKYLHSLLFS